MLLITGCVLSGIFYHTSHGFTTFNTEIAESIYLWIKVDPFILQMVFLPVLIFASSFASSAYIIGKQIEQILWLAIPGVAFGTVLTGVFVHYVFPYSWSWTVSLLLGAIVSATDPVSVISILKELGAPEKVATLIEGESLFNDGTAIVAFKLCLESVLGKNRSVGQIIAYGTRLSLGGPAMGILGGIIGCYALSRVFNDPVTEITITLLLAYGVFTVCETEANVSGILGVVFLGLWLSFYGRGKISPSVLPSLDHFWVILEFIANTIIFFVTGLIVVGESIENRYVGPEDWGFMFLLFIWLILVRLVMLLLSWPIFQCGQYGVSWQQMIVMSHAGLRGAVSLILALIVGGETEIDQSIREKIIFHTSGIAVLTLIINGSTTKLVVQCLGLNRTTEAHDDVFEHAINAIDAKLAIDETEFMNDPFLSSATWTTAWRYIPVITSESLWRRISLGYIKLSGEEVKDIRKHYDYSHSSHRALPVSGNDNKDFDFSFMLRDAKDDVSTTIKRERSFVALSNTSRYISTKSNKLWRHGARWRYSELPPSLRIQWFDILKTFHYDHEMIGEAEGIHIDDFLNKYGMAGEKEPPREWDLDEVNNSTAQNNGIIMATTDQIRVSDCEDTTPLKRSSSLMKIMDDPSDSMLRLDPSYPCLHGRRRRRHQPGKTLQSKSSHGHSNHTRETLDTEEIKEARMRVLAAIKAAYLSQFQRGMLVGDVYTILQSSVLDAEDIVDRGGRIGNSSLLQRVKESALLLPETTILRWFNWWPTRIPIMSYVSNRVFLHLSIAWNMRIAHESVNLKDLYGDCAFALDTVKGEVDVQVSECKEVVEKICEAAPFISRAFKTRFAARVLLFRYQQHANNLHMSGHILEAEADIINERVTRSLVALSNHPLTEGLPKLIDVCRSIECLHTLSAHEIRKIIASEAVTEHEILGSQTLMRIGDIYCANGRKGWYYLIRGSVVRTVPLYLAHCQNLDLEKGSPEVEDKYVRDNGREMDSDDVVDSTPNSRSNSISQRGRVFSRLRSSRPVTPTVSSEHHLGLLFGISDALLLHPQHAGYHTKESFTHLIFFDLHKMLELAEKIPRLKEGLWRTVGAHALRHSPQYCTFTLRSLHNLLHDSFFHEVQAGSCPVEFYLSSGSTAVVLRGSVGIDEDSLLKITKLSRDGIEAIAPPAKHQISEPIGHAKLLGAVTLPSNHSLSAISTCPMNVQTINAPLMVHCNDENVEILNVFPTAETTIHKSGAVFFVVCPKKVTIARNESKVINRVGSKVPQDHVPINHLKRPSFNLNGPHPLEDMGLAKRRTVLHNMTF